MLSEKQIGEIQEHLNDSGNPIFYYDNDADGLCSFLLLRRYLDRGNGVAVRSYPDLDRNYARKASELGADKVFILDKPVISEDFIEEIEKIGLPIVWIDHHEHEQDFSGRENFFEYNSASRGGDSEPVSYLCYKITERKEDIWIAMIGCIADHFMPDFVGEFKEKYSEYWGSFSSGEIKPFDIYYKTELGNLIMVLNFGLKDSITNVIHMQRHLLSCKSPGDVLAEVQGNRNFRAKYSEIKKKYEDFFEKAKSCIVGDLIFFSYGGEMSISADVANRLSYEYSDKYIAVAYKKGAVSNISLRGENVREIFEKVKGDFEGITGGGHENAVGARIMTEDLEKFKRALDLEVN